MIHARTFWTTSTACSVVVLRRAGRRGGSAAADRRRRPARRPRGRGHAVPGQVVTTAVERPHPRNSSCTVTRPLAHWPAGAAARRAGEHEGEEERDDDGGAHPLRRRDAQRRRQRSFRHGDRSIERASDEYDGPAAGCGRASPAMSWGGDGRSRRMDRPVLVCLGWQSESDRSSSWRGWQWQWSRAAGEEAAACVYIDRDHAVELEVHNNGSGPTCLARLSV